MENYLLCTSSKAQRAEFAKLRISSHKLMIESGRCNKPNIIPADKRYCVYCKDGSIEDENHFMMHCSLYQAERTLLYEQLSDIMPNFESMAHSDKFLTLMTCKMGDYEVSKLILPFVHKCMDMRNNAPNAVVKS